MKEPIALASKLIYLLACRAQCFNYNYTVYVFFCFISLSLYFLDGALMHNHSEISPIIFSRSVGIERRHRVTSVAKSPNI